MLVYDKNGEFLQITETDGYTHVQYLIRTLRRYELPKNIIIAYKDSNDFTFISYSRRMFINSTILCIFDSACKIISITVMQSKNSTLSGDFMMHDTPVPLAKNIEIFLSEFDVSEFLSFTDDDKEQYIANCWPIATNSSIKSARK